MFPSPKKGDSERKKWEKVPLVLQGRPLTLERAKLLFKENERFSELELLEKKPRYSIYGVRDKKDNGLENPLLYECQICQTVMAGPPIIEDINTIGPLTGREGYDVSCGNCGGTLEEKTFKMS